MYSISLSKTFLDRETGKRFWIKRKRKFLDGEIEYIYTHGS